MNQNFNLNFGIKLFHSKPVVCYGYQNKNYNLFFPHQFTEIYLHKPNNIQSF